MTHRAVRLALWLVVLVACSASGWFWFQVERAAANDRRSLAAVEASARSLIGTLGDAQVAMAATVAAGQDSRFWQTRMGDDLRTVTTGLATLRQLVDTATGLNDLDAAAAAVESVAAVDDRVTRLIREEAFTKASEAIFTDGIAGLGVATRHMTAAWRAEQQGADARHRDREQQRAMAAAATAGLALVVMLLLVPTGSASNANPEVSAPPVAGDGAPAAAAGPRIQSTSPTPPVAVASTSPTAADAPAGEAPRQDRRKATELKTMAELCTDFARVHEPGELPALLERAARVIDAAGFIVWVADPTGRELRPALAHGYSAQAVSRLPAIPRTADNATAAAWRESDLRIVRTNGMTPGALVVPLLTSGGCIGVLAAEVRHGRESSESMRALTRIIAAQIATLVSVPIAAEGETTTSTEKQAGQHA